jgi:HK97 family phage portal protein
LKWFGKKEIETREDITVDPILSAIIGTTTIGKNEAMNIPTVAGCVELIANTVATIPIKLYKEANGATEEVIGDIRTKLLNDETGDLLDGYQFKKALITDYLLHGSAFAYINKEYNSVKSLHYVEKGYISTIEGMDPIFKKVDISVNGVPYRNFEFINLTRNTKNGVTGKGILDENQKILSVAYSQLNFEENLVKTGGNKKGFLKSKSKLVESVMNDLKAAWKRLYSNNEENVVVLNDGIEFQEASNTSVEMQLNENKKTNAEELCKLFSTPPSMLNGTATEQDRNNFIKNAIMPILKALETAINKSLLLESEKGSFYFACDTKELLKGNIKERYEAYKLAVEAGWIGKNEIRFFEDFEKVDGLDIITMSLGEIVFDMNTKKYFTPNMGNVTDLAKGGEKIQ